MVTSKVLHNVLGFVIIVGGGLVVAGEAAHAFSAPWDWILTALLVGIAKWAQEVGYRLPQPGDRNGLKMGPGVTVLMAALTGILLASPVRAQVPILALDRLSAGATVGAAVYAPDGAAQSGGATVQGWTAYSLTSALSLAASVERDPHGHLTVSRAGGRASLTGTNATDRVQLAVGVDAVWYADGGTGDLGIALPSSWSASLRGSWLVAMTPLGHDLLYLVGSAERDLPNKLAIYRAGLRITLGGLF